MFIFTQYDPASSWDTQYFDNYQSDKIWLGDIQASRISGTNKESKSLEMVVLAKIGDYYLQALSNQSKASLEYFDPVISSIRFVQAETETPPRPKILGDCLVASMWYFVRLGNKLW